LLLLLSLATIILSTPYQSLLPIFVDDVLKVGAKGMGILMSVSSVGAVIASLTLASLPNRKRGLLLLATSLILGLALVGFSFSTSWYLSLIVIVFVGLGQTSRMTLGSALLMYYTKEEYLGRVMSIYQLESGLTSFGTFFAAVLTDTIGIQWAVGGFAMVLAVVCVFVLAFSPRLRKLD
jgi:MFS family permease